jgi:hypothetical protein
MAKDKKWTLRYSRPQGEIDRIGPDMLGEWILGGDERGRNSISLKLSVNTAALLSVALQNAVTLTDTDNNEIELSIKQIKREKKKIRGKEKDVVVGRWTVTVNAKAAD